MNRSRYISSPSHRKAERDFAVKVWIGVLIVIGLALAGFFRLEEELPQPTQELTQYEVAR